MSRLLDGPYWVWCWIAYHLVLAWPNGRLDRAWFWLLPYAGFYGYHDPTWMSWRRSAGRAALSTPPKENDHE